MTAAIVVVMQTQRFGLSILCWAAEKEKKEMQNDKQGAQDVKSNPRLKMREKEEMRSGG